MLNMEPLTLEKLEKLVDQIEPKTIFINKKTYESIMLEIDFEPSNILINNYLPDNQAIIMNDKQLKKMKEYKPLIQF